MRQLYTHIALWNDDPRNFLRLLGPAFVSLACLELFAYICPRPFAIGANGLWIALTVVYFITSVTLIVQAFISAITARSAWYPITLVSAGAILFFGLGNPLVSGILYEGLEQLGSVLNTLHLPAQAYISLFHGYPTRQWVWPAIPSLLFGRSLLALQLGYLGLFMLGISLLFIALQRLFTPFGNSAGLAAIAIVGLLTFPRLYANLARFEQSEHPLIYGIHAMAWLLLVFSRITAIRIVNTVIVGCMLCVAYTPAMAGALLLITIMIYEAVRLARTASSRNRYAARAWALGAAVIATYFLCSFFYRGDLIINPTGIPLLKSTSEIWCLFHRDRGDMCGHAPSMGDTLTSIGHTMVTLNAAHAIFPLWMAPLAGLLVGLGLLGRLGLKVFALVIWLVLFTVCCGIASGFSGINPQYTLTYRLMLSFPIWTVLVIYMICAAPYGWLTTVRAVLIPVVFVGLLANAVFVRYASARAFEPMTPNFLIPALERVAVEEGLLDRPLDLIFATEREIISQYEMERLAMYFFPTWQVIESHATLKPEPTNDTRLVITDKPPDTGAARPLLAVGKPIRSQKLELYFALESH